MIDKLLLLETVQDALEGTDKFLVNLKVTPDNRIFVDIDGDNGIDIDDCAELSRTIEERFNRDDEDYELNVSSAGADAPLKLPRQYVKNIGRKLAVTLFDGTQYEGRLIEADNSQCLLATKGSKKEPPVHQHLSYTDIKSARVIISFE